MIITQLSLRPLTGQDADPLFKLTDKNRHYLRQWLPWLDSNSTINDTIAFIEHHLLLEKQGKSLNFLIYYANSIIGTIGIRNICNNEGIIGFWLDEDHQNKGIMTWACVNVIDFCRKTGLVKRIILRCSPYNSGCQAVARKCHFDYIETVIDAENLYGVFNDLEVYYFQIT